MPIGENLVDKVWVDRPEGERPAIFIHEEWAGRSSVEKLNWVRDRIREKKGEAAIFNDLSEIGWLLNLRSS